MDIQTGIGAAAHASSDIEQFISHTPGALADTNASLQDYDKGVSLFLKVHELLTKFHGILDSFMSEQAGNTLVF